MAGIFLALFGNDLSERGGLYICKMNGTSLGLGYDFLCNNQDIALFYDEILVKERFIDDRAQVGSWGNFTNTIDGNDTNFVAHDPPCICLCYYYTACGEVAPNGKPRLYQSL